MKQIFYSIVFLAVLFTMTAGCEQPADVISEEHRLSLNDNREVYIYAPTAVEFAAPQFFPPEDITVTVKNTWNQRVSGVKLRLAGDDRDLFELSTASISALEPGASADVVVKVPKTDPRRPRIYKIALLAGNEDAARKLPITYTVFAFQPDASVVIQSAAGALPLQAGGTAAAQGKPAGKPWFSSNPAALAISADGTLNVLKAGAAIIGFIDSTDAAGTITVKGTKTTVYPSGELGPILASAAVTGGADITALNKLVLVYQNKDPVAADGAGFSLKNASPAITFSKAAAGPAGSKTLTLTMSRRLSAAEITANNLELMYDSTGGQVQDSGGRPAVSGSVPLTRSGNLNPSITTGTNRALPASRSGLTWSAQHTGAGLGAVSAVDGSDTTRWATPSSTRECWIAVHYSAAQTANMALVKSYGSRVTGFKVEYNDDGGTVWNTAYSYSGGAIPGTTSGAAAPFECIFDAAASAKYFRFHITAANEDPTIWEFELYNATVTP